MRPLRRPYHRRPNRPKPKPRPNPNPPPNPRLKPNRGPNPRWRAKARGPNPRWKPKPRPNPKPPRPKPPRPKPTVVKPSPPEFATPRVPPPGRADAVNVALAVAIVAAAKPIAILGIMMLTPTLSTPAFMNQTQRSYRGCSRAAQSRGV